MIWVLLVIGFLLLLPLFFKALAFGLRIVFAIIGPLFDNCDDHPAPSWHCILIQLYSNTNEHGFQN